MEAILTKTSEEKDSTPVKIDSFRVGELNKLGLKLDNWEYVVALAGNPNTGKSTVFNRLTGLKQHTGNWPGKTVSRAEGGFEFDKQQYKLVDLPGTYSLLSISEDEEIARNFILFAQPDVTVVVVDATRLERNLNLTLQILEITDKVVVCLNLMDEAKRKGISIDVPKLESLLGVPVVASVARFGKGQEELLQAIAKVAKSKKNDISRGKNNEIPEELKEAIYSIEKDLIELYPDLPNTRWIALRLLDGDAQIEEALRSGKLQGLIKRHKPEHLDLEKELQLLNAEQS